MFKMRLCAPLLATLLLVGGCNNNHEVVINKETGQENNSNLQHFTLGDREYYLALPDSGFNENKSYKLLLAFHDAASTPDDMQQLAELERYSENYIVAYPQASNETWNDGCDCSPASELNIDDLAFVEDLVTDIEDKFNLIDSELYAVGYAQGGLFVQNLMCNSPLAFNGIVSVAAPMSADLAQSCQISHATNYMLVHGTADTVLPYLGGKSLGGKSLGGESVADREFLASKESIALIASLNGITGEKQQQQNENFVRDSYQNASHTNELVSVIQGGHAWSYSEFDTSNEVMAFFDSVSHMPLPPASSLYRIDDKDIHVRSMGLEHEGPAIVLLSGPNKNFHSDSAWFSLLQPLIAKTHRVHAIDRFGNAFSSAVEQPSYQAFVEPLHQTLLALGESEIILLSFASGNILAHLWQQDYLDTTEITLKGMLWIDPDILLPYSIDFYQGYPVDVYRAYEEDIIPHIAAGNWTDRTLGKLADEKITVESLTPQALQKDMDWPYFNQVSESRASIAYQLTRANEIINYHDDLEALRDSQISQTIPISVIDSDFELHDIEGFSEEEIAEMTQWQQEGSQWSQEISENSQGQYLPLTDSSHLVVFEHPRVILDALAYLLE
ncbi:alpha/beta hydrolase [Thalassomonas sp. RHCl1]|uniref:alpha/beta hydrolase n=1 Tax=Thalassomonas sp. RHCl1 TaxID=2995320 RepID=UPI00248C7204|nr:alpha/beta hydrolase [Thalassomonas sp. RHCl1]